MCSPPHALVLLSCAHFPVPLGQCPQTSPIDAKQETMGVIACCACGTKRAPCNGLGTTNSHLMDPFSPNCAFSAGSQRPWAQMGRVQPRPRPKRGSKRPKIIKNSIQPLRHQRQWGLVILSSQYPLRQRGGLFAVLCLFSTRSWRFSAPFGSGLRPAV